MAPFFRASALAVVAAVAVAFCGASLADDKPKPKDKEKVKEKEETDPKKMTVMKRKLYYSHIALEGLAVNDFTKVATGADGLTDCIKDVTWKINQTEKYLLYSNEFLRRAESLKKAAKDKNTDAAALAYVDLTLTCVKCHKYLREDRISAIPAFPASTR